MAADAGPARSHGQDPRGVRLRSLVLDQAFGLTLILSHSIDSTFSGSAVAVAWPKVFSAAQLTEVRQRKNSRSQSAHLPGETRDEIRAHIAMQTIGEDDDNAIQEDD